MQIVFFVALLMLTSSATPQEHHKTLGQLFLETKGIAIEDWNYLLLAKFNVYYASQPMDNDMYETLQYILFRNFDTTLRFSAVLGIVPLRFFYNGLNGNCSEFLETPIVDLTERTNDTRCVKSWLDTTLKSMLKDTITIAQKQLSARCSYGELKFCLTHGNCAVDYGERLATEFRRVVDDVHDQETEPGESPLFIIVKFLYKYMEMLRFSFITTLKYLSVVSLFFTNSVAVQTFEFENLAHLVTSKVVSAVFLVNVDTSASRDVLTWGVIRSNTGTAEHPCSAVRHDNTSNFREVRKFLAACFSRQMLHFTIDFFHCIRKFPAREPLAWRTEGHPIYFDSQCLCLAFNGGEQCGVKTPTRDLDPQEYCLSVLLNDFKRRVWHRPAVTYLDYAVQTPVPMCKFTNLLSVAFLKICIDTDKVIDFTDIVSARCFFKDLVNRTFDCSAPSRPVVPTTTAYNRTELCLRKIFTHHVICDDEEQVDDVEFRVYFYGQGNSGVVLALTYLDVVVRIITLVTYLSCPPLFNLPGKLLVGYQLTALLRLVAVRGASSILENIALAVRLDVSLDLASTLWLTAYLHFLTMSIRTLRVPDSLSTAEAVRILVRYALMGWALPSVLSAAFFLMDDSLDSRVLVGQLLFVVCNYVALLGNLAMFLHNFNFYRDVKKGTVSIKVGATERGVFADLFNFALKTSVLSGAGIVFRLIFTQIQGLENLLGYYHALGALHGLLIFLLYGCNREGRAFWIGVASWTLRRCRRRQNTAEICDSAG